MFSPSSYTGAADVAGSAFTPNARETGIPAPRAALPQPTGLPQGAAPRINRLTGLPFGYMPGDDLSGLAAPQQQLGRESVMGQEEASFNALTPEQAAPLNPGRGYGQQPVPVSTGAPTQQYGYTSPPAPQQPTSAPPVYSPPAPQLPSGFAPRGSGGNAPGIQQEMNRKQLEQDHFNAGTMGTYRDGLARQAEAQGNSWKARDLRSQVGITKDRTPEAQTQFDANRYQQQRQTLYGAAPKPTGVSPPRYTPQAGYQAKPQVNSPPRFGRGGRRG